MFFFTGAWGRVGRPHCVRTSFRDRSRVLTEQNRHQTRILGTADPPLDRKITKSDDMKEKSPFWRKSNDLH